MARLAAELDRLGVPLGKLHFATVHRLERNMCLMAPGHLQLMFSVGRKSAEIEGLALAGEYLSAPCLEAAVISGRRAAEQLMGSSAGAKRLGRPLVPADERRANSN